MLLIEHKTSNKLISIEKYTIKINSDSLDIRKKYFDSLCQMGCINFGKKFSCPPFSPSFDEYKKNFPYLMVICLRLDLSYYKELKPHMRIKAGNSILKGMIDRILKGYKNKGFRVVGSGSCRLCKPCGAKEGVKCKKPDERIYSLESLGVDVSQLVRGCFGFDLEWYSKENKEPSYTCTVGGVLLSENKSPDAETSPLI
ncbi:DUF2284 domain-containing protein [Desulforegula conservatrix]|uniref:DUF2284 domain-containing protein n=1 Tax=Desulforegula conservatrix TaxID=153026 RepID=UPI0004809B93|nr:DUF2284 domain-containing protein [Desulforegula conservatrix]